MSTSIPTVADIALQEWSKVVAILAKDLREVGLAEEMTQEAFLIAMDKWPEEGVPQRPGAWLLTVARRRAIDHIRRESTRRDKQQQITQLENRVSPAEVAVEMSLIRDEELQLIFACCHPSFSAATQLALILRCVLGIPVSEIASAFLVPTATMEQRLVRAKRKIKDAGVPLQIPNDAEIVDRVRVVCKAIYLIFNEGYIDSGSSSVESGEKDFKSESIRLARLLSDLVSDNPECKGLLALLLFVEARQEAQVCDESLVLLEDQDRKKWNWPQIEEAREILMSAIKFERPGEYQIQAAINELYCCEEFQQTDFPQIVALYDSLLEIQPSPVVRLSRAVAIAFADSYSAGLKEVEKLSDELSGFLYFHSTRGNLLKRLDRQDEAHLEFVKASKLASKSPEVNYLKHQIEVTNKP